MWVKKFVKKEFKAEVKTEPEWLGSTEKRALETITSTSKQVGPEPMEMATTITPLEQEITAVTQTTPRTPLVVESDTTPEEEIDIEKDAEISEKTKEAEAKAKESGTKPVMTEQYNKYKLTGSGEMPEQKVNNGIKDINFHNLVVVIAVGDKVINKVGGIQPVAEKWGLSFSMLQGVLSELRNTGRVDANMTS